MLTLNIKVIPGASREKIGEWFDDYLKIYVKAPPEGGKANRAVIKLLASALKLKENDIFIQSGLTSQKKVVGFKGSNKSLNSDNLMIKLGYNRK